VAAGLRKENRVGRPAEIQCDEKIERALKKRQREKKRERERENSYFV